MQYRTLKVKYTLFYNEVEGERKFAIKSNMKRTASKEVNPEIKWNTVINSTIKNITFFNKMVK